jgi:hypothetical protein
MNVRIDSCGTSVSTSQAPPIIITPSPSPIIITPLPPATPATGINLAPISNLLDKIAAVAEQKKAQFRTEMQLVKRARADAAAAAHTAQVEDQPSGDVGIAVHQEARWPLSSMPWRQQQQQQQPLLQQQQPLLQQQQPLLQQQQPLLQAGASEPSGLSAKAT